MRRNCTASGLHTGRATKNFQCWVSFNKKIGATDPKESKWGSFRVFSVWMNVYGPYRVKRYKGVWISWKNIQLCSFIRFYICSYIDKLAQKRITRESYKTTTFCLTLIPLVLQWFKQRNQIVRNFRLRHSTPTSTFIFSDSDSRFQTHSYFVFNFNSRLCLWGLNFFDSGFRLWTLG